MTYRRADRKRHIAIHLIAAAAAGFLAAPANAGQFSVSPVRIYMTPKDRATAVTVVNEGSEELVMQADIYAWSQKAGGEDQLVPSEDLFLAPPIVKLAPNARTVVRLARVKPVEGTSQVTYRMILREVQEAKPIDKGVGVAISLAFSLPVFITPPGAKNDIACTAKRSAPDAVLVDCGNTGNAYGNPRGFELLGAADEKLATRDTGGYILPGIQRQFDMKRAGGPIPSGKAKLAVSFDDGSTKTFDVQLAD
jgi:fimbrial chaperone protein